MSILRIKIPVTGILLSAVICVISDCCSHPVSSGNEPAVFKDAEYDVTVAQLKKEEFVVRSDHGITCPKKNLLGIDQRIKQIRNILDKLYFIKNTCPRYQVDISDFNLKAADNTKAVWDAVEKSAGFHIPADLNNVRFEVKEIFIQDVSADVLVEVIANVNYYHPIYHTDHVSFEKYSDDEIEIAEKNEKWIKSWPRTLDQAVNRILDEMSEKDKETIRNTKFNDLGLYHLGWGMEIRNIFGLWAGNEELLKSCGCTHPDDASMMIIESVWKKLQSK